MFWHLQFFRYCTISFSCKSLCLKVTANVSIILESVLYDIALILNLLSEGVHVFREIWLVLEIKNVNSLIKTHFIKSKGCVTTSNYEEALQCNGTYNLMYKVFAPIS